MRYELISVFAESNDILANFEPSYVDAATGREGRLVASHQPIFTMQPDQKRADLTRQPLGS